MSFFMKNLRKCARFWQRQGIYIIERKESRKDKNQVFLLRRKVLRYKLRLEKILWQTNQKKRKSVFRRASSAATAQDAGIGKNIISVLTAERIAVIMRIGSIRQKYMAV